MLYLAIIWIACAVSAPSEAIATTERINEKTHALCHVDKGNQNHTCHGEHNNTSEEKSTELFVNEYLPREQCNMSGVCNSCRSVGTLGNVENSQSEHGVRYRRRDLLWFNKNKNDKDKIAKSSKLVTCKNQNKFSDLSARARLTVEERRKLIQLTKVKTKLQGQEDPDELDSNGGRSKLTISAAYQTQPGHGKRWKRRRALGPYRLNLSHSRKRRTPAGRNVHSVGLGTRRNEVSIPVDRHVADNSIGTNHLVSDRGGDVVSVKQSNVNHFSRFNYFTHPNDIQNSPPKKRKKRNNFFDYYDLPSLENYDWTLPEQLEPETKSPHGRMEFAEETKKDTNEAFSRPLLFETTLEKPLPLADDIDVLKPNFRAPRFRRRGNPDYDLPPYRYSKLNRCNHLIEKKALPRLLKEMISDRRKRSGVCTSCSMPRKCWRSAPLLCIPYIRKGQDELLKYLIRNLQKMLGKPFPQKVDIFEKTKYKPNRKKPFEPGCEDIMPESDSDTIAATPPPCPGQPCPTCSQPCPPCPQPCPPCPQPCQPCPQPCQPCPQPCRTCIQLCRTCPQPCRTYPQPCPSCPPPCQQCQPPCQPACQPACQPRCTPPCPTCPATCPTCQSCAQMSSRTCPECSDSWQVTETPLQPEDLSTALVGPAFSENAPFHIPTGRPAAQSTLSEEQTLRDASVATSKSCNWCPKNSRPQSSVLFTFHRPYRHHELSKAVPNDLPPSTFHPLDMSENLAPCPKYATDLDVRVFNSLSDLQLPMSGYSVYQPNPNTNNMVSGKPWTGFKGQLRRKNAFHNRGNMFRRGPHLRRHKSKIKYNFPVSEDSFPVYDYDVPENKDKGNAYPLPWFFNREYHNSVKKDIQGHTKRKKRSFYRTRTQPPDNYIDHSDSPEERYIEKGTRTRTERGDRKIRKRRPRKSTTTPPVFALFSDLAEAITSTEAVTIQAPVVPTLKPTVTTEQTSSLKQDHSQEVTHKGEGEKKEDAKQKPTQASLWNLRTTKSDSQTQKPSSERVTQTPVTRKPMTAVPSKAEEESDNVKNSDGESEAHSPTTLKAASIAKGPKKLLTRPAPKMYSKVYPDSITSEVENTELFGDTTIRSATTLKPESTTPQQLSATTDTKLKLFALCEGYLEAVKLIKGQNASLGDELDPGLSRYCENIISQSFNSQDQPKVKTTVTTARPAVGEKSQNESLRKSDTKANLLEDERNHEQKSMTDNENLGDAPSGIKPEMTSSAQVKNESTSLTDDQKSDTDDQVKLSRLEESEEDPNKTPEPSTQDEYVEEPEAKEPNDQDELETKEVSQEQPEVIQLLRNGKSNILSGLINTNENELKTSETWNTDTPKPEKETCETTKTSLVSGTIEPKGNVNTLTTPKNYFPYDSVFPVYAKNYGYTRGSELKGNDVLWPKISDRSQQKELFRNLTMLAQLLTATKSIPYAEDAGNRLLMPRRNGRIQFNIDDLNRLLKCGDCFDPSIIFDFSIPQIQQPTTQAQSDVDDSCNNSFPCPPVTTFTVSDLTNTTANISEKLLEGWYKMETAKELLSEYSVELLNYAIIVIPIVLFILIMACCLWCFIALWRSGKRHRRRKNNKGSVSSDFSSSDSPGCSKRCGAKKKKNRKLWSQKSDCKNPSENSQSFFRFFRRKRKCEKSNLCCLPYVALECSSEQQRCSVSDREGTRDRRCRDDHSDDADRREIISLLEELKKIETERLEDKKDRHPVTVQYLTQEPDPNMVLRPVEIPPVPKPNETSSREFLMAPKYYPVYDKRFPLQDGEAATAGAVPPLAEAAPSAAYRKLAVPDASSEELEELLPCDYPRLYQKSFRGGNPGEVPKKPGTCDRILKAFRDSSQNTSFFEKEMDLFKSGNKNLIFNKYRSVTTDTSKELLLGGEQRIQETEYQPEEKVLTGTCLPYSPHDKSVILAKDREVSEYQAADGNKNTRLKDDGVLCRL
ncbi:hypothetical protein RUM44_006378 [Polyplax serrata]|uniref:Uncharacterized protein n=1 Tax=Polyplax serrata TaxID=468196 RepID=A0ABR1AHX6_POLSC